MSKQSKSLAEKYINRASPKILLSECCHAPSFEAGSPDFDEGEICTCYTACGKCKKPCNLSWYVSKDDFIWNTLLWHECANHWLLAKKEEKRKLWYDRMMAAQELLSAVCYRYKQLNPKA